MPHYASHLPLAYLWHSLASALLASTELSQHLAGATDGYGGASELALLLAAMESPAPFGTLGWSGACVLCRHSARLALHSGTV